MFPLSPSRAKGRVLNRKGRLEAGLTEDFIGELALFNQSRGRTPDVFYFNPLAEHFVAEDAYVEASQPEKKWAALQKDLAVIPFYLCRQGDVVLLPEKPNTSFLSKLSECGFKIPEMVTYGAGNQLGWSDKLDRRLHSLQPWAWSPDSIAKLAPLFPYLSKQVNQDALWNERLRKLYGKHWSAQWVHNVYTELGGGCMVGSG